VTTAANKRWHRISHGLLAVGIIILASKEAIVGTYGSYTNVREGYTLAKDIAIGSLNSFNPKFDKSKAEANALVEKQQSAERNVEPFLKDLDALYARVFSTHHPFEDRLSAIDNARATASDEDFRCRVPAPIPESYQLYIHMKPGEPALRQFRGLIGWALAQVYLGGYRCDATAGWLIQKLPSLEPGELAAFILQAQSHRDVLEKIAQDLSQNPSARFRAALLLSAYKNQVPSDHEWALAKGIEGWEWILLLAPESELANVKARLEKNVPLSSYGKEELRRMMGL